ncbi:MULTISPECIES: NUDIX hydrolase [Chryseobacterium]|uniref:8-oxo-dGTP diphosphatase n=1 Tax=Chryseobacterium camelliae TaxID=1265445 RepID=A0ABU0TG59_9FLAO|nr:MULTISPECIES: NUDIX domain-containing protein [Chryseobacterium]MDT3406144.1 8-oxo-dGTP diphosphatase [Pseudacidovorax intermedius]MDQ1096053.1 8-oxo-dGTP diphosphatase [Chryseobacterium camelliae]MDQ1099989.1 8-oxo-dGTP diphosphatase [Chryseobacterium sp. SORGH_AS_1048]MDR6087335.1 8-oxo-dGTP diphosphatase [Chryseobacterium sp. SORGH_AS_0909]MDR6131710.1 8-oxo-dGTP diphosphatase [Chryseobacterium sp. SORGH_AS_1175]
MSPSFIHTYVSVDCVVFGFDHENRLNILLAQRHFENVPIERQKKLPGSLILSEEDVDDAAQRVLHELTGIKKMVLKQFKCFADPMRASSNDDIRWMGEEYKHNIDRIITVAYLSLCKIDHKINSTKYDTVDWCPIDKVPLLPFDHNKIISESLIEIRKWIESDFSIIFELLPKRFTIRQLYQLYSALSEKRIDIKNFHKKISSFNYIIPLDEIETNVAHRAARYYKFDAKVYKKNNTKLIK